MKTNAIVRIILFSLAIVVLLSILGVGIALRNFSFDWNLEEGGTVSSTGSVKADSVRNLQIEWVAGTITIQPADVTEITFTETCGEDAKPMVWSHSGSTLTLTYAKGTKIAGLNQLLDKDLLIQVPRDWSCEKLEIDTASADLVVNDLTIDRVDFDGASGDFDFQNCTVDKLDVDTASGDIRFCGNLNTLDCDAASADCEITVYSQPSRIEMDMVSGDLDLTLPEGCGFTATLDALSGRLDTDFEITRTGKGFTAGDGTCRIDISALSGDLYIHKAQ